MSQPTEPPKGLMQKFLDIVEKVGNRVPHPAVIFLCLIALVVVLAHVFYLLGTSVTTDIIIPVVAAAEKPAEEADRPADSTTDVNYTTKGKAPKSYKVEKRTVAVRSLLSVEGVRFVYVSLIPNFMGFTAVGLMIVAMVGAGVAEESGLVNALIRKLVIVSPRAALTYILVFVGIVSSVAADAGYLVLIPLAGSAFLSVGRHPVAGLATAFAAVAGAFTVNILIKPLDAVLTEFTNDALRLSDPNHPGIGLTANLWFSLASVPFLTVVVALITERVIEPRLGEYKGEKPAEEGAGLSAAESRGLRFAGFGLLGVLALFGLLALPPGAPLRNPEDGALLGNSPFMSGLIAFIMILFLVTGAAFGFGAGTMKGTADVIKAMEKAITGLGGLIFLLLIISQFIAYFNYTNLATVMAVKMGGVLREANIPPLLLLLGFIAVVVVLDLLITGAIAKWAIFAPVFVPLLVGLGVAPEAVLAAYRIGDSPANAITPLNAYFIMVVTLAQRYDKNAGVGTVVALMLPYVAVMLVLWTLLFTAWFSLGLPWGL
ncbi:MAG: AbgT family transporter [Gemmataceae bacterium]